MKILSKMATNLILKGMCLKGKRAIRILDNNSKDAYNVSNKLLMELIEKNKETEYGRKYNFERIKSVEDYRRNVPLSTYDDYKEYIKRMVENNETGLILSEAPVHYALTSGSAGSPKYIPVTEKQLEFNSKYITNAALYIVDEYYRNTTSKGMDTGGLCFNPLEVKLSKTEHGYTTGAISAKIVSELKKFLPFVVTSPWSVVSAPEGIDVKYMKYLKIRFALEKRDLAYMISAFSTALVDLLDYMKENHEQLCDEIEKGIISLDLNISEELRTSLEKNMKPDPKRADELRKEFRKGFDTPIVPRIWPRIKMVSSIGTGSFFAYYKKLRGYIGRNVPYHNLSYVASEALIAVARRTGDTSYVLIPDGGFYEFIPADAENDNEILTMDQLEEGKKYEIIITNLSGLYRYRINDIVRVTGYYNELPMVEFVHRKNQVLSIAGEKTNEEILSWAVETFCKETGLNIVDYSMYGDTTSSPGHYIILMETDRVIKSAELREYRDIIERLLMQGNPSYGDKIRSGVLGDTELLFVQQETYQLYREVQETRGVSMNQIKPVRVIDTPMKKNFFFSLLQEFEE